ncbi:MAG: hypothetical protein VX715_12295 [Planctomycetota bacterium]|nr:hypothetical protein [Planctomycetota bacterium]
MSPQQVASLFLPRSYPVRFSLLGFHPQLPFIQSMKYQLALMNSSWLTGPGAVMAPGQDKLVLHGSKNC